MRAAILAAGLLLASCAGDPYYRDPGDSAAMAREIDDRNLASRVRFALGKDPITAPYEGIRVSCARRVVRLEGSVDREVARDRAVELARGIEGVRRVRSAITVRTGLPD